MENSRKKDLVREYKERKAQPGIVAVRCTDAIWVGASRNVETQKNGIWFQLRMGNHMNRAMQAAWTAQGGEAFTFEVLEVIEDENPQLIDLLLKDRETHWRTVTGAGKLFS